MNTLTISPATENPHQNHKQIEQRIITEFNYIGISPNAVVFQYMIDTIQIVSTLFWLLLKSVLDCIFTIFRIQHNNLYMAAII